MSRIISVVVTMNCDWSDCDKQFIHVGNVEDMEAEEGWLTIKAFGQEWDLCPDHASDLEDVLNPPPLPIKPDDMEPDV